MGRCEKPGQPQLPGTQSHNGKLRLTPCRFELLWDATNYHEMLLVTLGSSELPRTTLTYSENSELPWKAPSYVGKLNVTLINWPVTVRSSNVALSYQLVTSSVF